MRPTGGDLRPTGRGCSCVTIGSPRHAASEVRPDPPDGGDEHLGGHRRHRIAAHPSRSRPCRENHEIIPQRLWIPGGIADRHRGPAGRRWRVASVAPPVRRDRPRRAGRRDPRRPAGQPASRLHPGGRRAGVLARPGEPHRDVRRDRDEEVGLAGRRGPAGDRAVRDPPGRRRRPRPAPPARASRAGNRPWPCGPTAASPCPRSPWNSSTARRSRRSGR